MSTYSRADTKAQWFASAYPGAKIDPNCGVLHTTEGTGWPDYGGGKSAPNYTARPDFASKRLVWRAHFPDEMSSRALMNQPGGVDTNTANLINVELVGTCDPKHATSWNGQGRYLAGTHYIFWPAAPDWAKRDLATFLKDMHARHGIRLEGPAKWLPYPKSYGSASGQRMAFAQWREFYGWCGHQHVPENDHGDPGSLDFAGILALAKGTAPTPVVAALEDDMAEITEQNARDLFTGHAILKDARATNPDTAPRVAPSALIEYAASTARTTRADVAALGKKLDDLATQVASLSSSGITQSQLEAALRTVLGSVDN